MIVIVDYGMGNVASIVKMMSKIGYSCIISNDKVELENAALLILPGIGHFSAAMERLKKSGLHSLLNTLVMTCKKPILGICLGMQLMTKFSEEGDCEGFGWIDATVQKFKSVNEKGEKVIVPHMGWNYVTPQKNASLMKNMPHNESRFYFVHSYYVCAKQEDIFLTADYNGLFCAAFYKDNIMGLQFHPEKSHQYGMALLKNILIGIGICSDD